LADTLGVELIAVGTSAYGVQPVTVEEAIAILSALESREAALVKGSRVAELERVIAGIG
jgi:hypothetical protein